MSTRAASAWYVGLADPYRVEYESWLCTSRSEPYPAYHCRPLGVHFGGMA